MAASIKILKIKLQMWVFPLIFAGVYCSYGDVSVNALQLWRLQDENMRTINFILLKWNSQWKKNFWIKESTWEYF